MSVKKSRWSKVYESSEEELIALLEAMGITAKRWEAAEWQSFNKRSYDQNTRLWCAEGSIVYTFADTSISLQPGDSLYIPASTPFTADAGISGCACYEAPVPN